MRIKVKVNYINPTTVNIVALENTTMYGGAEEGKVFKTLHEGDEFFVDNQMKAWRVERSGKLLKLCHATFCREGRILYPDMVGLWAMSSGAARRGILHSYMEPKNLLEKVMHDMKISSKAIQVVDMIDVETVYGGYNCRHRTNISWKDGATDGEKKVVHEIPYVEKHQNQYHIGCPNGIGTVRYCGGTYLILYTLSNYMNGHRYVHVSKIYITKDADKNIVAEKLKNIWERG